MTRKEKIKRLEEDIAVLERSIEGYFPNTKEQSKENEQRIEKLKQKKDELRKLLYTNEEIKYQARCKNIEFSRKQIEILENSVSILAGIVSVNPDNKEALRDYNDKSQSLKHNKEILRKEKAENENDYFLNPLQINISNLDVQNFEVTLKYGSDAQKRLVDEMLDLRLLEEYSSLSLTSGYIRPYYVDENGKKVNYCSGIIGGIIIPKNISMVIQVLRELATVPRSKMKIGNKEITFNDNYKELEEELEKLEKESGISQPLEAFLELINEEDKEWKLSFSYGSYVQVDKIYNDFENRFIPQLGVFSDGKEEFGCYIKPCLTDSGLIPGNNQIESVIIPNTLLHVMIKHLVNDDGVKVNMGDYTLEDKFDLDIFIKGIRSFENKEPKM